MHEIWRSHVPRCIATTRAMLVWSRAQQSLDAHCMCTYLMILWSAMCRPCCAEQDVIAGDWLIVDQSRITIFNWSFEGIFLASEALRSRRWCAASSFLGTHQFSQDARGLGGQIKAMQRYFGSRLWNHLRMIVKNKPIIIKVAIIDLSGSVGSGNVSDWILSYIIGQNFSRKSRFCGKIDFVL